MIAFTFALVASVALLPFQEAEKLTAENFEGTLARILPEESELRWKDVDWRVALADGIRDARVEGKPILLWAMNGHPLGCV
ncbi:MAG: hypothetical protein P1V35_10185 [Planctomycetota bacterium]|nr:hypothetical protein [Planctomycetota bacterium]